MKMIKLAALRTGFEPADEFSNPYSKRFDRAAAYDLMEKNRLRTFGLLCEAGKTKPDLALTSISIDNMMMYGQPCPDLVARAVETIPGPTSDRLSELAKTFEMMIAASYNERDGDDIYSTVVLFGKKGELIGKYRKVHLPAHEKWTVTPGREINVMKTEIGNIGVAICHDIAFPEHCRTLAMKGADIILYPTDGWGATYSTADCNMGEALVRIRASENACFLVAAKTIPYGGPGGKSCVVSPRGAILAENAGNKDGVVVAECGADFDITEPKHHFAFTSGADSARARYAVERVPSAYAELTARVPALMERYAGVPFAVESEKIEEIKRHEIEFQRAMYDKKPHFLESYHW